MRKAGTSFGNVLFHHPQICPNFPPGIVVGSSLDWFNERYPRDRLCQGGFAREYLPPSPHHDHDPFGTAFSATIGHAFTMIRDPKQRIISDWIDSVPEDDSGNAEYDRAEDWMPVRRFADDHRGLAVRMLTRGDEEDFNFNADHCCSDEEVDMAISRLNTFAFVGLTDRWQMSVCLFHAMFGGEITASEFRNVRLGTNAGHHGYDTSILGSFVDDADEALYARAVEIFECNLEIYQVTEGSCIAMKADWSQRWSATPDMAQPTTRKMVEGAGGCMAWCNREEYAEDEDSSWGWDVKCMWEDCRGCDDWRSHCD